MKKIKSAVAILLLPMCFLWGGCQNTSEPAMPQDFIGESPKGERLLEKSPYTICFRKMARVPYLFSDLQCPFGMRRIS